MKKSLCIEMVFTEVPFHERFALAKEAGFDFVEFWGWKGKDIDRIRSQCAELGLGIASFSGDADFSLVDPAHHDAYVDFIGQSLERARALSCPNLVIHSNALGEGGVVVRNYVELLDSERYSAMFRTLTDLVPVVRGSGVRLVLEALNTKLDHVGNCLAYTRDSAAVVASVGSPDISMLYDVYHMQIMEGNLVESIWQNAALIGYVHIADVPGRAEPGTGEINYPRVFRALSDSGYTGFVGFELAPSRPSKEVARELARLF